MFSPQQIRCALAMSDYDAPSLYSRAENQSREIIIIKFDVNQGAERVFASGEQGKRSHLKGEGRPHKLARTCRFGTIIIFPHFFLVSKRPFVRGSQKI